MEITDKKQAIEVLRLIELLSSYADLTKIISTFIPAMQNKIVTRKVAGQEIDFLTGNFNLGGTKSGRLSCSEPNLQQLPSTGTPYAKHIKRCFKGAPGYIMVGADYASLEMRIQALITRDPEMLKVYEDHFDGHSVKAYAYFKELMPDIENKLQYLDKPGRYYKIAHNNKESYFHESDPDFPGTADAEEITQAQYNVGHINAIEHKYPELRQKSKGPSFSLQYKGTYRTLMRNNGFDEATAKKIETNYHELYKVSDNWVREQLRKASTTGYVELAFGLRLYTPILKRIVFDSETSQPYQAHKEAKTAGNALGQSYGLLNTRSANLFMERIWNSEYALSIFPIAQIHDAQYYMIKNDLKTLHWFNINLIECMQYADDLPELKHLKVKLEAQLEVFYPDWAHSIAIPNAATMEEIAEIAQKTRSS